MPSTPYLGLTLPTYDDNADIEVLNANLLAIDAELQRNRTVRYVQSLASVMWTVTHNLGAEPVAITVIDVSGDELDFYAVHHTSANALEITFGAPTVGTAVLKA